MKLEFSGQISEESSEYQIWWKSIQWEPSFVVRTDGQTWRSKRSLLTILWRRLRLMYLRLYIM